MRLATVLLLAPLTGCLLGDGGGTSGGPEHLVGAGLAYGECLGYCTHQLSIAGRDLEILHTSNTAGADLVSAGRLTDAGAAALVGLETDLQARSLAGTYGCPDCNDGGAAYLDLLDGDDLVARVSWAADAPDPVVAGAHALLIDDLLRGLGRCQATPNLTIGSCTAPD